MSRRARGLRLRRVIRPLVGTDIARMIFPRDFVFRLAPVLAIAPIRAAFAQPDLIGAFLNATMIGVVQYYLLSARRRLPISVEALDGAGSAMEPDKRARACFACGASRS